ncbi:MAG: hydroxysqualene dehydroxylase HpnE, partial [Dehalococcoidia bacterium]
SVIVVGGGLAGLAAACRLADAGLRVTLVEKRPFLGGRVYSHLDKKSGLEVDNGQHVFLRCCSEYIRFLKELGVYDKTYLQRRLRFTVIDKLTGPSVLSSSRLPAPLHLLPSFLRYRSLSLGEKLVASYALARIRSIDRARQPELDEMTFHQWLRRHGQSERAIRDFWNLIIQPTLNDDAWRASADLALMVFQEGFLSTRDGASIGYAKVGLSALLAEAAADYIRHRGGEVLLGQGVEALALDGGRVSGLALADGGSLAADYVVAALPPQGLLALLPAAARHDPFFAPAARIRTSPIVNLHLWFDRSVTNLEFAAFLNSPLGWVFNKSKLWGQSSGDGQYLDISISAAHDLIDRPGREIIHLLTREVQAFFPAARTAEVKRALVVKQRDATFAPLPGIAGLRLPQRTPVDNLFLAGDWTRTGWPATMESAVRSGEMAARELLQVGLQEGGWEKPDLANLVPMSH